MEEGPVDDPDALLAADKAVLGDDFKEEEEKAESPKLEGSLDLPERTKKPCPGGAEGSSS